MMAKRTFFSGLLVMVLVAGLAACSSSSKPASTSNTTSHGATATGAPIKVGVICDCSGSFGADDTANVDTYKAFMDAVNASGGINGHQVQLIVEDEGGIPGNAITDIQTLISDHVDAVLDWSIYDETWASTIEKANIPVVGADVSEPPFQTNPDFYASGQTENSLVASLLEPIKLSGATKFGVLYCAEAPSCSQLVPAYRSAAKDYGLTLVYSGSISATAPNYTAQCLAAEQAHATALVVNDSAPPILKAASNCNQQNYDPTYVTLAEGDSTDMITAPGMSKNNYISFADYPYLVNTPTTKAFNTTIDKYYPGLRKQTTTFLGSTGQTWAAGLLLEAAVKAGGLTASATPSAAEILTGLHSLKGATLGGWSPPLTFKAGQANPVDCWFTAHIQNGAATVTNNSQPSCLSTSSS